MDKTMRDMIVSHAPSAAETLDSLTQGESCFIDPTGAQVGESVQGEEGIAYATLDLNECVEPKQFHDVVGYYQRFDVFDLKVDRRGRGVEGMFVGEESGVDGTAEGNDGTGKKDGGKTEPFGVDWNGHCVNHEHGCNRKTCCRTLKHMLQALSGKASRLTGRLWRVAEPVR
jgi:hypothetical protein